jgi:hypothetical protein
LKGREGNTSGWKVAAGSGSGRRSRVGVSGEELRARQKMFALEPDLESPRRIWEPQTRRSCRRRTGHSCRQGPPGARTGGRKNQGRANLEKILGAPAAPLPHPHRGGDSDVQQRANHSKKSLLFQFEK